MTDHAIFLVKLPLPLLILILVPVVSIECVVAEIDVALRSTAVSVLINDIARSVFAPEFVEKITTR